MLVAPLQGEMLINMATIIAINIIPVMQEVGGLIIDIEEVTMGQKRLQKSTDQVKF